MHQSRSADGAYGQQPPLGGGDRQLGLAAAVPRGAGVVHSSIRAQDHTGHDRRLGQALDPIERVDEREQRPRSRSS